jgi:hypothetical protein
MEKASVLIKILGDFMKKILMFTMVLVAAIGLNAAEQPTTPRNQTNTTVAKEQPSPGKRMVSLSDKKSPVKPLRYENFDENTVGTPVAGAEKAVIDSQKTPFFDQSALRTPMTAVHRKAVCTPDRTTVVHHIDVDSSDDEDMPKVRRSNAITLDFFAIDSKEIMQDEVLVRNGIDKELLHDHKSIHDRRKADARNIIRRMVLREFLEKNEVSDRDQLMEESLNLYTKMCNVFSKEIRRTNNDYRVDRQRLYRVKSNINFFQNKKLRLMKNAMSAQTFLYGESDLNYGSNHQAKIENDLNKINEQIYNSGYNSFGLHKKDVNAARGALSRLVHYRRNMDRFNHSILHLKEKEKRYESELALHSNIHGSLPPTPRVGTGEDYLAA